MDLDQWNTDIKYIIFKEILNLIIIYNYIELVYICQFSLKNPERLFKYKYLIDY